MKFKLLLFLSIFILFSCKTTKSLQPFKYSIEKPIEGQLYTAQRLREYMDAKDYEKAINLFSKKEQANIARLKKENIFEYWSNAWTFNNSNFDRYVQIIKNSKAHFIFEDGVWKIDEK
jgi:hypothetical protein